MDNLTNYFSFLDSKTKMKLFKMDSEQRLYEVNKMKELLDKYIRDSEMKQPKD